MSRVAIVTDSTADLPAGVAAELGVGVVPLFVTIGDATFEDGSLSQDEFFSRLDAEPRPPKTSQAPVGMFAAAYEKALETAESVVSIHISSKLSGTVESARQAAAAFAGRVLVEDSLNLSMGLGFQVIAAARAAAEGADVAAVRDAIDLVRRRVRLIVGLDTLHYLAKGGRIGKVSAFFGGVLDLKVLFDVEDGEFCPLRRARGARAALEQTLDWVAGQMGTARGGAFCILHAHAPDKAERLQVAIRERWECPESYIVPVGAVISAHTGTGWGIAFVPGD